MSYKHLIKRIFSTLLLLPLITISLLASNAWSHGGVSVEDDMCLLRVGPYKAHFTGYQPEVRATQEFCEDIPVVGNAIFVLDFISDDLRIMKTDFRIIKDVNEIGNKAVLEDLGSEEDIEKATIFYKQAALYPRGTVNAEYRFDTEGRYIGILKAIHPDNGREYISVFPFQVGLINYMRYFWVFFMITAVSIAVFVFFLKRHKAAENADAA
ncbi:MAG TPA: hypothetical protein VIM85_05505 [Pseudomonadales bacterium]